jgi:PAS domain S-box-containing protein
MEILAGVTALILVVAVLFLFFVIAFRPLRVVRDYERLVLFRLGRYAGERGPGLVWIWPVIDQVVRTNLREDFLEIPSQTCITQDNAPIDIDFLIFWKVVDPGLSVLKVRDFAGASQGIATTTLRAVIGDIPLDDVLAKREQINQALAQSESRYRAIVEDQTELVCRYLPNETITFVNEAYCRYFGKTREELEGHSFMPLIPEEDQASAWSITQNLSIEAPVGMIEHRVILPNGQVRWQQPIRSHASCAAAALTAQYEKN